MKSRSSYYLLKASEDTSNITLVALKPNEFVVPKVTTDFDEKSVNTVRMRMLNEWLSLLNLGTDPLELQELITSIEEIV